MHILSMPICIQVGPGAGNTTSYEYLRFHLDYTAAKVEAGYINVAETVEAR
jgi:hypothetical protein